ncbi:MAG: hypothetical protein IT385_22095 [Deltaproteobacteria bacterium]|nr:hypothetical protein [Deltaproteobacteria bacterium]
MAEDEARLREGCSWLERAIARDPARDDSLMMFMRGMRPKCGALLEGLARKDGSVTPKTIGTIVKELQDLRDVVDADWKASHPNEPDPAAGPDPAQKAAAEKAAADRAAAERAAAEKAAADKAAAEQAAAERAAAEKAAADRAAAERAGAQETKAAEKARLAEEKRQAEAARRAEKERLAAERQAAAEAEKARRAAEKAEKERLAAEKKAEQERLAAEKRAAADAAKTEQAERERLELERQEREMLERDLAEAERIRREALAGAKVEAPPGPAPTASGVASKLDGTWEQPPTKVLDKQVKRTLNLITKGKKVEGELFEEVWFPAPTAWIDRSCGGNTTFRMVTTARVTGEIDKRKLELRRDVPRVLACTCSSRCTVEERRRGLELELSASGQQLTDDTGVFARPGSATVVAGPGGGPAPEGVVVVSLAGAWETSPFSAQDRKVILRLELEERDGKLVGTLTERSTQALPLQSWSERFCGGATAWEWVSTWQASGKIPKGRKVSLGAADGQHILCTCPSKCRPPDKKRALELELGPDGRSLSDGSRVFERR